MCDQEDDTDIQVVVGTLAKENKKIIKNEQINKLKCCWNN